MVASNALSRFRNYWFTPVNNSPLVVFRILFGAIMFMEFGGSLTNGWVTQVYVKAPFRFTFIGFEFLNNMQGEMMYVYFLVAAIFSILVSIGLFYRPSMIIVALMWSAVYFSQKAHYNNHYYLMVLLCWLMVLMPANRRASMDVRLGLVKPANTCYRWQIQIFIAQIAIVYTYASIAKMYGDWLKGIPVRIWFSRRTGTPLVGPLFGKESFIYFIAYTGIIFDMLVVPALLWKKTRNLAVAAMLMFHFFNGTVFGIGVFPFLAMSLNVFFYPGTTFDNVLGKAPSPYDYKAASLSKQKFVIFVMCTFLIWQALTPLRHHFYKGDVTWTEEGHRMSWRMMLRTKSGHALFKIRDKSTDSVWYNQPLDTLLRYQAGDLGNKPDFIWQYAQILKKKYAEQGIDVAVYSNCRSGLNGRKRQYIVDPDVDLAAEKWKPFSHHDWIIIDYK